MSHKSSPEKEMQHSRSQEMYIQLSYLAVCWCEWIPGPKAIRAGKGLFNTVYSPLCREVKAGMEAEAVGKHCLLARSIWLAQPAFLHSLPRDGNCPQWAGISHSSLIKKTPYRIALKPIWWEEAVSQLKLALPDDSSLGQVDTKPTSTQILRPVVAHSYLNKRFKQRDDPQGEKWKCWWNTETDTEWDKAVLK